MRTSTRAPMVLNRKTAKALGLAVRTPILLRAAEVIDECACRPHAPSGGVTDSLDEAKAALRAAGSGRVRYQSPMRLIPP